MVVPAKAAEFPNLFEDHYLSEGWDGFPLSKRRSLLLCMFVVWGASRLTQGARFPFLLALPPTSPPSSAIATRMHWYPRFVSELEIV